MPSERFRKMSCQISLEDGLIAVTKSDSSWRDASARFKEKKFQGFPSSSIHPCSLYLSAWRKPAVWNVKSQRDGRILWAVNNAPAIEKQSGEELRQKSTSPIQCARVPHFSQLIVEEFHFQELINNKPFPRCWAIWNARFQKNFFDN